MINIAIAIAITNAMAYRIPNIQVISLIGKSLKNWMSSLIDHFVLFAPGG